MSNGKSNQSMRRAGGSTIYSLTKNPLDSQRADQANSLLIKKIEQCSKDVFQERILTFVYVLQKSPEIGAKFGLGTTEVEELISLFCRDKVPDYAWMQFDNILRKLKGGNEFKRTW